MKNEEPCPNCGATTNTEPDSKPTPNATVTAKEVKSFYPDALPFSHR